MRHISLYPQAAGSYMELNGDIKPVQRFIEMFSSNAPGKLYEMNSKFRQDFENHWYEYIPSTYSEKSKVPLVISCHPEASSGMIQIYETTWCYLAERENFIVVYPDAVHTGTWMGNLYNTTAEKDGYGVLFLNALIDDIMERYNIDKSRVYMQGTSMGGLVTIQFAGAFGHRLAGISCSCCPANRALLFDGDGKAAESYVPIAAQQIQGTYNKAFAGAVRNFWLEVNKCEDRPVLYIDSRNCYAFFKGRKADVVFKDVLNRGYTQSPSDAEAAWDLFSTVHRDDEGNIVSALKSYADLGDKNAVALADGCIYAYVSNKKVPVGGKVVFEKALHETQGVCFGERLASGPELNASKASDADNEFIRNYIYVPVRFLETAFEDVEVHIDGEEVTVYEPKGRTIKMVRGNTAATVSDRICDMGSALKTFDGQLYLPFDWFTEYVMGKNTCCRNQAYYVSARQVALSDNMASLIEDILK